MTGLSPKRQIAAPISNVRFRTAAQDKETDYLDNADNGIKVGLTKWQRYWSALVNAETSAF
ncbi:hypothetical protein, partial [Ruegeria sp. HKCCA4812]|uniref:hypothetical protein n=1 Tax=Ruegeria sp. HKCCA4812 TaxID=2682993 RepID=UPI0014898345